MLLYNFLLVLVIGLVALVNAAPLSEGGSELLDVTLPNLPNRTMTGELFWSSLNLVFS